MSNTTINHYLSDIKLILKEAYRTEVIDSNLGARVRKLAKDSKVHRNPSKPTALQAHAYAQGNEIYLSPG